MANPRKPDTINYENDIKNTNPSYIGESIDIDKLAKKQGIKPVNKFEDLLGDFWPENENVDEFISAIKEWKKEGNKEK